MKERLVSFLKPMADRLFEIVNAIPPSTAVWFYIAVLVVILFWVFTLKNQQPGGEAVKSGVSLFSDLRVWAAAILVIQIAIYVVFR